MKATNPEHAPDLSGSEVQGTAFDGSEVHRGFRDALAELWDPDEHGRNGERLKAAGHKALLATLQEEAKVAGTQFLFTGHSLGGGKATLAAAYTSLQNPANSSRRFMKENVASVVTFGSPKVGNDKFVAAYDKALGAVTFPFEHNDDFVRAMPPGLGYQHVGSSNLLKLGAATGAAGRLDSHRMHYYVEQMEREAAKEIAATSRPVAALRPRFADVFVAG